MRVFRASKQKIARLTKWVGLILVSASAVAGILRLDSHRQRENEITLGLRWARQMATQAETLSLTASEKGETDPLAWAARILSQGTDSRILYASKYHAEGFQQLSEDSVENYGLDSNTGVFDYSKILYPQDAAGIRLKLFVARTGVFGAKTLLGQDLTLAGLFFLIFGFLSFATRKRKIIVRAPRVKATHAIRIDTIRAAVNEWITQAHQALIELGTHIREMTRSAQKISSSAKEAREQMTKVHAKLHETLTQIHATTHDSNDLTTLASEAENLFSTSDEKTKSLVRKLLKVSILRTESLVHIERRLEDAVISCDQAYHALKDVGGQAQEMSKEIKQTTQGILSQSQLMGDLKKRGA